MPIRRKFILILLLFSITPLIVVGIIFYTHGHNTMRKTIGLNLKQYAIETINHVSAVFGFSIVTVSGKSEAG